MRSRRGLTSLVAYLVIASFGFILVLAIIKLGKLDSPDFVATEQVFSDRKIGNLKTQSASDSPADIQKDLDDTDLNNLDTELDQVSKDSKDL